MTFSLGAAPVWLLHTQDGAKLTLTGRYTDDTRTKAFLSGLDLRLAVGSGLTLPLELDGYDVQPCVDQDGVYITPKRTPTDPL